MQVHIPIVNTINKKSGVLVCDHDDYLKYDLKKQNLRLKNSYAFHKKLNDYVHRIVTNKEYKVVDHINKNRMDCRKKNLRKSNYQLNKANSKAHKKRKFKGVRKSWSKFRSTIVFNGKQIHLGMYPTELEAAKAYNDAALKYFGSHAELNDVRD